MESKGIVFWRETHLGSLHLYYFSIFKEPLCVIDSVEKTRERFLWGGIEDRTIIHWVAWEKVIASKDDGGLRVGSLCALNLVLLVKWIWKLKSDRNSISSRNIYDIHNLTKKTHLQLREKTMGEGWKSTVKS